MLKTLLLLGAGAAGMYFGLQAYNGKLPFKCPCTGATSSTPALSSSSGTQPQAQPVITTMPVIAPRYA